MTLDLGTQYWKNQATNKVNLNLNTDSSTSAGSQIASQIIGGIFSIGTAALVGANTNTNTNTNNNTPKSTDKETPTTESKIKAFTDKIAELDLEIVGYDSTIKSLQGKTDQKDIDAQKAKLDELQAKLFDKNTDKGKLAKNIIDKESNISALTSTLNNKTSNYQALSSELQSLETSKANAEAVLSKNPDDENAKEVKSNAETQIPQKKKDVELAKQAMDEVQALKDNAAKELENLKSENQTLYNEVKTDLETYNKEKSDYDDNAGALKANQEILTKTTAAKATANATKSFYQGQINALKQQLVNEQGKAISEENEKTKTKNGISDNYNQNDKADGNWFSRTWQKTKGIFSNKAKGTYQAMQTAHQNKKTQEATTKADTFLSKQGQAYNNKREIVINYYKEHPNANNKTILAYLQNLK